MVEAFASTLRRASSVSSSPRRQRGVLDLLNLIAQQVDAALFFRFIGDNGIQFLFDLDEFPVDRINIPEILRRSVHRRPECPRGGPGSEVQRSRADR